ncbi:MAG TPA: glycosyltransferase [Methylomirabilota bacterium]|nr:glycosyltransferase [Methylomirabilota bacterium]
MEGSASSRWRPAANGSLLVASGIEGIVDAVVDGKTGFLLPEGDAETWAAKIRELLAWSPAQRSAFVSEARTTIAQQYS